LTDDNEELSEEEVAEAITNYVIAKLNEGKSTEEVISDFARDFGLSVEDARTAITPLIAQLRENAADETVTAPKLAGAAAGGMTAAALGGWIWAKIAIATGYEVGYIALGVGFIVGIAVAIVSGGMRGPLTQLVGVVCACTGILLGKWWTILDNPQVQMLVDAGFIDFVGFATNFTEFVSPIDYLWFGLAGCITFSMLGRSGLDLSKQNRFS
tara:strand:- start:61 stop:696 length:636 start_codon:yes stop_codon:yes gene_type:complete